MVTTPLHALVGDYGHEIVTLVTSSKAQGKQGLHLNGCPNVLARSSGTMCLLARHPQAVPAKEEMPS